MSIWTVQREEDPMKTYKTFSEFHATVTKKMPDAVLYPEMYNLCYDLMNMAWHAAQTSCQIEIERLQKINSDMGWQISGGDRMGGGGNYHRTDEWGNSY